jgi:murein DD-endopeptidase MepM/ murein hydrolase activator NlpD
MTSCNEDNVNNYKYFTLGLHGFDGGNSTNLFDLTYGAKRDVVGYAYRGGNKVLIGADELKYVSPNVEGFDSLLQDDPQRLAVENRIQQAQKQQSSPPTGRGSHPIPGITSVQIKRSGLAAPLIAEVRWQCYNQQQLEFLRNHFLVVGSYIVLEWGQKYHDDFRRNRELLDFTDSNGVLKNLLDSVVKGRKYVIDNFAEKNDGNYDFVVGQVGNFTVDLDPATNIYKCSTRIVSLGENMWGMNTQQTTTVLAENDVTDANKLSDIHSYFEGQGSRYNQLLGRLAETSTGVKYCRPQQPAFVDNANNASQTGQVSPNPHDAAFISWTAFTNDVINDIIEMFNGLSVDPVTQSMYDKLRKELRVLLSLGGLPDKNLPADILEEQNRLYELEWIGNHKYLRSVDPDSLIIITPEIAKNNPGQDWLGNGIFGSSGDETRGKLVEGIWINAEMVREAFLKTTTLQSAIQQILSRMSIAAGNYWQLRLFYDDEVGVYKIIDYKFDHDLESLKFYVFNSHANDHHNETVDIKFDSAFPPELITQMMVVSMIQTASPEEQKALFKRYPLINNTSPFMFAVNWTSLRDVLKEQIKSYRDGYNIPLGNTIKINATGLQNNETNSLAGSARIGAELNKGSQTGKSPAEAGSEGTARTIVGSPFGIGSPLEVTPTAPAPRASVTAPPTTKPAFVFDSLPVTTNPLVITSEVGARNVSNNPLASRDHKGVDIRAPQGTRVYAVKDGKVNALNRNSATAGGLLRIGHTNGYETQYFHLSRIVVSSGEKITRGQLVGYSGGAAGQPGSGNSTEPHLHFELLLNGVPQDPSDSLAALGNVAIKQPDGTLKSKTPSTVQIATADVPPTTITPPKTPASVPATQNANTTATPSVEQQIEQQRADFYKIKFGNNILNLIYPTVSLLRNKITQDGYKNLSNKTVNAFISPFPTKTSVEVKIPGITGISISDGFMVDKLPFIFANYGVFQVTEITDSVTDKGWYTTVRGYFKMLWPDGKGGTRDD